MSRPSPITGQPMETVEFLGVHLDVCSTTGGIWFDEGEFGRIRKATEKFPELEDVAQPSVESLGRAGQKMCPRCATALYAYRFLQSTPIVLDGCETCNGMWVDEGELVAMQQALEQSRLRPQISDEAAAAFGQLKHDEEMAKSRARAVVGFFRLAALPRFWQL